METIYSNIIWDKLGEKNYKIHTAPWNRTVKKMCDYFKTLNADEIKQILADELSWVTITKDVDYYDGSMHDISQNGSGEIQIHDCALLPTLLHIMIELNISSDELRLLEKLLIIYQDKVKESVKVTTD